MLAALCCGSRWKCRGHQEEVADAGRSEGFKEEAEKAEGAR